MKPFVSLDGADAQGVRAEVGVQVGNGTVQKIEGLDGDGRNVQVFIKSDNAQVKKPIYGWLGKSDPIFAKVVEAFQSERMVEYRIETQRKKDVDRSTPIADLRKTMEIAKDNVMHIFAGLDKDLSAEAVTNPSEDPAPGGRHPATATPATPRATASGSAVSVEGALAGLATARRAGLGDGVVDNAIALALAVGATARQVAEAGVEKQRAGRPEPRSAHAVEAAPFNAYNTDGRVNLGSYRVSAAKAAETFAYEQIKLVTLAESERTGQAPKPVSLAQALGMARVLLGLIDRVQVGAYGGGKPDRMAKSYTVARQLVFDAIVERHPIPFGDGDRNKWMTDLVDECVERFRALADIASEVTDVAAPAPTSTTPEAASAEPRALAAVPSPAADGSGSPDVSSAGEPAADASEPEQEESAPAVEQTNSEASVPSAPQDLPTAGREQDTPPVVLLEGQPGFVAASEQARARFAALAKAAQLEPVPDGPISKWLTAKFGTGLVRKAHGPALERQLDFYEGHPNGTELFRQHVLNTANDQQRVA